MKCLAHWKEVLNNEYACFTNNLLAIQEKLYQFAYRLTTNADAARDLLQETSLAILDNEELFTPNTNFSAWCHTIMRNLFANQYRRTMRERAYYDTVSNPMLQSYDSAVDSSSDTTEILQVLELLPSIQKESFILHLSGFKYREIAAKIEFAHRNCKKSYFSI